MDLLRNIKISRKYIYIVFGIFLILSWIFRVDISFLFTFAIWFFMMVYSLSDIKNRILLSAFLVAFFTFLLGGHFVFEYFGMELKYYISDELYTHSNVLMSISLIFVLLGFIFFTRIKSKVKSAKLYPILNCFSIKSDVANREISISNIRFISKFLYMSIYLIWIYVLLDAVFFILNNSYIGYYANYNSNIPFVITAIANMTPYFFYLFLATMPMKKEVIPLALMQICYAMVSLLGGRRINAITIILFLVIYFIMRHYRDEESEVWIKKSYIYIVILLVPLGLISLYILNFIRVGATISNISIKELFLGFFQQQGFSSNIMRLSLYHEELLREDAYYSFFGITKYFRTNTILKFLFNPQYSFSYINNNVGLAVQGNSLAHSLSYIVLDHYLVGVGLGTNYIAELYHDFDYIGVMIGGFIYGNIMSVINKSWVAIKKYNVWFAAVGFALVESFLKAPRWNFDIIFTNLFDLGMWSAFSIVFVCCIVLKNKKIEEYIPKKYISKGKNGDKK